VPVGNFPHGVAVNIQTGIIYVTDAAENTVSVLTP
jgi:DNA-binding beta-propeller fold protein YncE